MELKGGGAAAAFGPLLPSQVGCGALRVLPDSQRHMHNINAKQIKQARAQGQG